jgi:hypothetical protein
MDSEYLQNQPVTLNLSPGLGGVPFSLGGFLYGRKREQQILRTGF